MRANNPKGVYTCKCGRTIQVFVRSASVSCNLHGEMKRVKSRRDIREDCVEVELLRVESGELDKDYDAHCEANI